MLSRLDKISLVLLASIPYLGAAFGLFCQQLVIRGVMIPDSAATVTATIVLLVLSFVLPIVVVVRAVWLLVLRKRMAECIVALLLVSPFLYILVGSVRRSLHTFQVASVASGGFRDAAFANGCILLAPLWRDFSPMVDK